MSKGESPGLWSRATRSIKNLGVELSAGAQAYGIGTITEKYADADSRTMWVEPANILHTDPREYSLIGQQRFRDYVHTIPERLRRLQSRLNAAEDITRAIPLVLIQQGKMIVRVHEGDEPVPRALIQYIGEAMLDSNGNMSDPSRGLDVVRFVCTGQFPEQIYNGYEITRNTSEPPEGRAPTT